MQTYKIIPYQDNIQSLTEIANGTAGPHNALAETMENVLDGWYGRAKLTAPTEGDKTQAFTLQGDLSMAGFFMLGEMTGKSEKHSEFKSVYMTEINGKPLENKKGFDKGVGYNI